MTLYDQIIEIVDSKYKMSWKLLSVLALVAFTVAQRSFIQLEIRKRHTTGDKSSPVGKLTINIHLPYNTVESYVDSHIGELITQQDFEGNQQVILQFVCVDTDLPDYKERVYMTSVDQISFEAHGQKIAIILGPYTDGVAINAINYVQTRERVGEVYTEVIDTHQTEQEIFKYQYAPKKSEAEDESFWSRYKWPLIIGGVVLYTMMNANPDAQRGAAAGGSGR